MGGVGGRAVGRRGTGTLFRIPARFPGEATPTSETPYPPILFFPIRSSLIVISMIVYVFHKRPTPERTKQRKTNEQSPSACEIRSDHDPKFYLRYTDCWVGEPSIDEDSYATIQTTPFQCRLRDCTYSAPIYVNVRYTRGRQIVVKKKVVIGRMPIMLRSSKCLLRDKSERDLARMKECPYDPGGYFIVKGVEKVILIQEQLSKNRVIIEEDPKTKCVSASITSSTRERKSKAYIFMKHGRLFLKHNTLADDVPICVAMKAMGVESDVEFVQSVGSEPEVIDALALSLEEPTRLSIATQRQALLYIGNKMRAKSALTWGKNPFASGSTRKMSPEDEARDVLANVVLSHVPVDDFDFRTKVMYTWANAPTTTRITTATRGWNWRGVCCRYCSRISSSISIPTSRGRRTRCCRSPTVPRHTTSSSRLGRTRSRTA